MISTKNIVISESQVPSYWVFQYYLNIPEKLTGQDLKIKSIWNSAEKTPSMCLFVDRSKMQYAFKDFSSGKYGNKINLVQELFGLDYASAVEKMINDYNSYVKNGDAEEIEFNPQAKWELDSVVIRNWTQHDANFWLAYRIGKTMLEKYNVKAIEKYTMARNEDGAINKITIEGEGIYGYYDKHGMLYKIYQPYKKKHKFHKLFSHVQGLDQLEFNQPFLVICSSLKDAMCLKGFGYNLEVIAPDSENTIIKPEVIDLVKTKYKSVITLFDNDAAGKKAIDKYHELYGLNGTFLTLSKDVSDAVKEHGFEAVHQHLKPLLKQTLYK